jgi:serine protease AprX
MTEESMESGQHYAGADQETSEESRPPMPVLRQSTVADALSNPRERKRLRMPEGENDPGPVVVELNLLHEGAFAGAAKRFKMLCQQVLHDDRKPQLIANTYFRCALSMNEIRELVRLDQAGVEAKTRSIYRIWPDFPVYPLIDRSVSTVKADAARRSYEASGEGITWAVIDSGISRRHPHFGTYRTLDDDVAKLHKNFSDGRGALVDGYGHGTHVAGIIAGGLPAKADFRVCVGQRVADDLLGERIEERTVAEPERLTGVAPRCKLVSLRVLDDDGNCRSTGVISALQYIREQLNGNGKLLQVHGVNLSLGYEFDAKWFACGRARSASKSTVSCGPESWSLLPPATPVTGILLPAKD